jgi:hypothetical protein
MSGVQDGEDGGAGQPLNHRHTELAQRVGGGAVWG